jgi:hypothetical protein
MFRTLFTLCGASRAIAARERGQEIRLWPAGAPGPEGQITPESFEPATAKLPARLTVVHYQLLYVFLPPAERANGAARVIAPGAGIHNCEGGVADQRRVPSGIAAFAVKNRLEPTQGWKYTDERDALVGAARVGRRSWADRVCRILGRRGSRGGDRDAFHRPR